MMKLQHAPPALAGWCPCSARARHWQTCIRDLHSNCECKTAKRLPQRLHLCAASAFAGSQHRRRNPLDSGGTLAGHRLTLDNPLDSCALLLMI